MVHAQLVAAPRDLSQVQMDELRKAASSGWPWPLWSAPRLWLGGAVSYSRDSALITALVGQVRACASALTFGLLFCSDGLKSYISAIRLVFREPVTTGQVGRPSLRAWPCLFIAQAVKQYKQGRSSGIERRLVQGEASEIERMIATTQGEGVINTVFIERLNATFRQCLAILVRRTRALAK